MQQSTVTADRNLSLGVMRSINDCIAAGNYDMLIGPVHGNLITVRRQEVAVRERETPVYQRLPAITPLLGRRDVVAEIALALESKLSAEAWGVPGVGKSTLLRHLAYHPITARFRDGVIALSARHQPVDDILQALYDALYASDSPETPSRTKVARALKGKRILVLLDNVELPQEDVDLLLDHARDAVFVLASTKRHLSELWRDSRLRGLSSTDGVGLIEQRMGTFLSGTERDTAGSIATALRGHPLDLLQVAAMAEEDELPLSAIAPHLQGRHARKKLATLLLERRTRPERQIVAALNAVGNASLPAKHIAGLTRIVDPSVGLEELLRRHLIHRQGSRYRVAANLGQVEAVEKEQEAWRRNAMAYFVAWAGRQSENPALVLEEIGPITELLKWGSSMERWSEVLSLGRTVEGALAAGRRWGLWKEVLDQALLAARRLNDLATEGWTLHQMGTRALALDERRHARALLEAALDIRQELRDQAGAALTRHNLTMAEEGLPQVGKRTFQSFFLVAGTGLVWLVLGYFSACTGFVSGYNAPSGVGDFSQGARAVELPGEDRALSTETPEPTATNRAVASSTAMPLPTLTGAPSRVVANTPTPRVDDDASMTGRWVEEQSDGTTP